mgnify:CR=1 FL=1
MSEENNWNYGNDEPNVNQGNPVSLEKSTTDGTAGVNLEKTVTGNEERVNPEKTMTDNPYYTNTSYGNGNTNYNTDSQMTVQVITMDSQTEVQIIIMDSQMAITSQKVKDLVLRR